jgi:hypothetical protein
LFSNSAGENEFEKRKTAIAMLSLDQLPTVIDSLITAVRNGELDEVLVPTVSDGLTLHRSTMPLARTNDSI